MYSIIYNKNKYYKSVAADADLNNTMTQKSLNSKASLRKRL